jgi:hypothetical protein
MVVAASVGSSTLLLTFARRENCRMCSIGWIILGLIVCPRSILVRGQSDVRTPFYYRIFADVRSVAHASAEQPVTILVDSLDLARNCGSATENGLQGHFQTKYNVRTISAVTAIGSTVLRAMSAFVPCRSRELCHD